MYITVGPLHVIRLTVLSRERPRLETEQSRGGVGMQTATAVWLCVDPELLLTELREG